VSFTLANADAVFRDGATHTAFPDLAGRSRSSSSSGRSIGF
jgi:hypothetical protein